VTESVHRFDKIGVASNEGYDKIGVGYDKIGVSVDIRQAGRYHVRDELLQQRLVGIFEQYMPIRTDSVTPSYL
jgi:hypothetical protein